jgi:hypothetical protein
VPPTIAAATSAFVMLSFFMIGPPEPVSGQEIGRWIMLPDFREQRKQAGRHLLWVLP